MTKHIKESIIVHIINYDLLNILDIVVILENELKFNPQVLFSDSSTVYPESSPSDEIDDRES